MKKEIIEYIRKNRVSSTEIADCLYKTGAILGVHTINRGHFKVGEVFWVYAYGGSNWDVHDQLQNAPEGSIVLIDVFDCDDKAIFGDIVSKYLFLYKQVAAIVVRGNLRDAPRLIKENWPIWCAGFSPIGCTNEQLDHNLDEKIIEEYREKFNETIAICDDTGVVIIPKDKYSKEFYNRMEFIEEQEDIWYECVDRKKWSTYETICLKKYLDGEC